MFNINGYDWEILIVSPNHPELLNPYTNNYTLGSCNSDTRTIYLSADLDKNYLKKVLCHEIVHACMFSYDIELSYDQEELIADLIATYGQEIVFMTNSIFCRLKQKREL